MTQTSPKTKHYNLILNSCNMYFMLFVTHSFSVHFSSSENICAYYLTPTYESRISIAKITGTLHPWCDNHSGRRGQRVLQIISLNTLINVVRLPKARTLGK